MNQNLLRGLAGASLLGALTSCNVDNLLNQTASFGGETAGQRGQFRFVVINNTPYRAIFTVGAYDDLDQKTKPQFWQFGGAKSTFALEGNASSQALSSDCARVLALGTSELLHFIRENQRDVEIDEDALIEGVYFSSADLDSAEATQPTEGVAPPFERRLGVDFACNSYVVLRFEIDDVGPTPFRIDFEVIPASDERNPPQ